MTTARITITPTGANGDETIIAALRQDLLSLPKVKRVEAIAAEDTQTGDLVKRKSGSVIGVAGIALTLAPIALRQAVSILKIWSERQKSRTIIIELEGERLEIKASSNREQQQAMELFLQRHARTQEIPSGSESLAGD